MVFGRSGQMFPRQRAFHDAIYEEEYGSDQEDECCQSRGFSAIFCWFISVIILLGLAASVVLALFFLFKGKGYSPKNELDVSFGDDGGLNFRFPETTTVLNNLDINNSGSSSTEYGKDQSSQEDGRGGRRRPTLPPLLVGPTTRFPPSRRGPHQIFEESSEEEEQSSLPFQNLYPNGRFSSHERNKILRKHPLTTTATPRINVEEATEESSSSEEEDNNESRRIITPSPHPTTHQVLFTSPPITTSLSGPKRDLQTTRVPTERTSFTSSTEATEYKKDDEDNETTQPVNGHTFRPPHVIQEVSTQPSTTLDDDVGTRSTSLHENKDDVFYTGEESQVTDVLVGHNESKMTNPTKNDAELKTTAFNLPQTTSDPLARLIKNLAPKWTRNRTVETTMTTTPPSTHRYDFTISSRERNGNTKQQSSQEIGGTTRSGIGRGSSESGGIRTVSSPNLSQKDKNDDKESDDPLGNSFMDILVGNEDEKSLVTKQTEDGIVTSAILPPWFETGNPNNVSSSLNTTNSAEEEMSGESSSEEKEKEHNPDSNPSASTSVLGGLLDFFRKLPMRNPQDEEGFNPKRIVLKRPTGELLPPDFNQKETKKNGNSMDVPIIHTVLPSNIMTTTITPTDEDRVGSGEKGRSSIERADKDFNDDSAASIYGYYPDDEKDNDKTVEHHVVQSERILDPNELVGHKNPTHSIEVKINSDASSEVVIEQDQGQEEEDSLEDEYAYTRYGEAHAGSEIRKQIVQPPSPLPTQQGGGGGIRRPINNVGETTDLEMKGSENRPLFANTQRRNISPQLIRQRGRSTTTMTPQRLGSGISEEVIDNGAEKDPLPQQGNRDLIRRRFNKPNKSQPKSEERKHISIQKSQEFSSSGSVEEHDGSLETPEGEGILKPMFNSTNGDSLEKGSDDGDRDANNAEDVGSGNRVDNQEETEKVFHVFPVGYSSTTTTTTTTAKPTTKLSMRRVEQSGKVEEDNENVSGFVPPTPVNFHENHFTFPPPASSNSNPGGGGVGGGIYQSKDGWRPIVYNSGEENAGSGSGSFEHGHDSPVAEWRQGMPAPSTQSSSEIPVSPSTVDPIKMTAGPNNSNNNETQPTSNEHYDEGEEGHHYDDEGDEDVKAPSNNNNNEDHNNHDDIHNNDDEQEQSQESINMMQGQGPLIPMPMQRSPLHHHQVPQQQQQMPQMPFNHPHPPHHHPHPHHPYQQPQSPFHFNNNLANIDRSKYMLRPAPPPIMMRRNPTLSYMQPNALPARPQLIPHVQMPPRPSQFPSNTNSNNPESQDAPQNYLTRRRFKTLGGARPRSNSNHWEEEEERPPENKEKDASKE